MNYLDQPRKFHVFKLNWKRISHKVYREWSSNGWNNNIYQKHSHLFIHQSWFIASHMPEAYWTRVYIYHLMCPYFFLQLGNITLAVPNDVLYLSSGARQFQHYQYSAYICKIVSCSSVLPQIVMPISWLLYSMFGIHERTFIFSTPFIA